MTAKFYAILTNQGAARLANAAALGTTLNLTQMAVGDANGALPTPDPAQTKLINQQRIAPLNRLSIDPDNASQIIAEQVIPESEGGFWIRELGLFDDSGALIAIANCPETYKPLLQEGSGRTQTIRMVLIVSSTAAVTLKIDPAVVLATRKYVDDKVIEVKAYADDLMKKHIAADNPHAQYLQAKNNLSDVADKEKGRSALGLGSAALKNTGTSGDTVPLASGENTWSAKQTFSGGAVGSLSGNAETASKLKSACSLWGNSFDGSGNVDGTVTIKGNDDDNAFFKLIEGNTTTDGGYIAVGNNGKDKGYVEIGTTDDAITSIYARKRDASNKVVASLELLNESNDSIFPGKVTFSKTSSFGVNTDNALGDNAIVIGDSDTGFKQNGDGVLDVYANSQQVLRFEPNSVTNFNELAYYSPGAPVGSGAFAEQLSNSSAPFVQKNWNWTPGSGGHYVPLIKGVSTRAGYGWPSAVSFGYLLPEANGYAIPTIHVCGDNNFDALWQFSPKDKTLYCPGNVYAGGATYQTDGNIGGEIWGGYLSAWLNNAFAARDGDIANRVDWGSFNNRSHVAGTRRGWWYKEELTGLVIQGGVVDRAADWTRVNFLIGYQQDCFSVQLTIAGTNGGSSTNIQALDVSASGFTAYMENHESVAFWMAVGV